MRVLLDTNQVLFICQEAERLTGRAIQVLGDPAAEIFVSAASFWEINLKSRSVRPDGTPKLRLKSPPSAMIGYLSRKGCRLMPIEARHTFERLETPLEHRDPFDWLFAQQAQAERCRLLTSDRAFRAHPVAVYAGDDRE